MSLIASGGCFKDICLSCPKSKANFINNLLGQQQSKIASCYNHCRFLATCHLAKGDLWNPCVTNHKSYFQKEIAFI